MEKRGRKPTSIQIVVSQDKRETRYTSLQDALTAALPLLAEAIIRGECVEAVLETRENQTGQNQQVEPPLTT